MRFLIIGPSGAGKTSLSHALTGVNDKLRATQMIEFVGNFIDTPGVYLEYPRFYEALVVCSQQADYVLMVIAANQRGMPIPPGFAHAFFRPVIGVINKIDLVDANIKYAGEVLVQADIKQPYYRISTSTGEGLSELKARLDHIEVGIKNPDS